VNAGDWFTVATIPSGYRPAANTAVVMSVPGGGSGLARTGGAIELRAFTSRAADTNIDFSGWWFV
jgi:hypothetical protein